MVAFVCSLLVGHGFAFHIVTVRGLCDADLSFSGGKKREGDSFVTRCFIARPTWPSEGLWLANLALRPSVFYEIPIIYIYIYICVCVCVCVCTRAYACLIFLFTLDLHLFNRELANSLSTIYVKKRLKTGWIYISSLCYHYSLFNFDPNWQYQL